MDQGPHVLEMDCQFNLVLTDKLGRSVLYITSLLAEHLSSVPVMRQRLDAVPSNYINYQCRVKAGLSIVGLSESLSSPFQVHLVPLQVLFSGTVGGGDLACLWILWIPSKPHLQTHNFEPDAAATTN